MIDWKKHRDEETCELIYTLYDGIKDMSVAIVKKNGSKYRIQILDHMPFHASTLKVALANGMYVYEHSRPL